MTILHRSIMGVAAAGLLAFAAAAPARADSVQAGVLTCNQASGWGFIFGSSREVRCTFSSAAGDPDVHYDGKINKFGVDIGYQHSAVIVWAVFAPTSKIGPHALEGEYGGVTASATAGVGVGANILVGGSDKTVSLQPVSVSGGTGLNVAAGIGDLTLSPAQ